VSGVWSLDVWMSRTTLERLITVGINTRPAHDNRHGESPWLANQTLLLFHPHAFQILIFYRPARHVSAFKGTLDLFSVYLQNAPLPNHLSVDIPSDETPNASDAAKIRCLPEGNLPVVALVGKAIPVISPLFPGGPHTVTLDTQPNAPPIMHPVNGNLATRSRCS